jgi:hypothetical protein
LAPNLNKLAQLYSTLGKYAEAEPLFRLSLAIRECGDEPTLTAPTSCPPRVFRWSPQSGRGPQPKSFVDDGNDKPTGHPTRTRGQPLQSVARPSHDRDELEAVFQIEKLDTRIGV